MEISKLKFLRSLLIPIIKQFGADIKIRHHWVRDAIVNLHSFRHKGYWFYGKNREVKRVMENLGLKVARLIRTAYGPFQLGQLPPGGIEEIPARLWREKLGIGRKKRDGNDD